MGSVARFPESGGEDHAVLRDGTRVEVRPIRPADAPLLRAFHASLSSETVYLRFFSVHPELADKEVERFTHVDGVSRVALVAVLDAALIAVGRYDREADTDVAEVAFVVADAYQEQGLGTILLERLADRARENGIRTFVADSLAQNQRMREVFSGEGFDVSSTVDSGVVRSVFSIEPKSMHKPTWSTPQNATE